MTYETEAPGYTNQTNAVAGEHHVHIGGWQCYKKEKIEVTKSWILLDSKSTTDIFGESKYLTDIKTVPITFKCMNNWVVLTTNKQGHLRNYGNVLYHTKAISNILSLSNIKKKNRIIYRSKNGDNFIVINTRPVGHGMIFTAKNDGLYYNDMSNTERVSMLSTV